MSQNSPWELELEDRCVLANEVATGHGRLVQVDLTQLRVKNVCSLEVCAPELESLITLC